MLFSLVVRIIIILLILCALFNVIKSCKLLKNPPLLTFGKTSVLTIIYFVIPIVLLILVILVLIKNGISLIGVMNIVVVTVLSFYLFYLSSIKNKITEEGISVKLFGAFSWDEVNKIEINSKYMVVYYQVKIPVIHAVNHFKVKLHEEDIEDISQTIFKYNINKKIIYIKS